jgi:hypothetical protein
MNEIILNLALKKLPNELIFLIRKMTYKKKKKFFLKDIENYYNIFSILNQKYILLNQISNLSLQLDLYLNENNPLLHGYIENYFRLLLRSKYFQVINQNRKNKKLIIEKYIIFVNLKNTIKHIRILRGLMRPNERNEMLEILN